ncbi:MAG: hypothetical protein QM535_08720 [Limnohabitans sp.]|nr:hypothetical protein [Limnohabitans sp.]
MALFFYLLVYSVIAIIAIPFFIIGSVFKKKIIINIGYSILLFPFFLMILVSIFNTLFVDRMNLSKNEIYGEYVIDASKFAGKNADWQHEHFELNISKDDILQLYIYNDNGDIVKTITKEIEIKDQYSNARLNIYPKNTDYHILQKNPTLYRNVWSYYYVFNSSKYGNMFFVKKSWYRF